MKRILKRFARAGWRLTGPIRRPLGRKAEATLTRIVHDQVEGAVRPRFDLLLHVMNTARQEAHANRVETNLVLDSLVREITRLQLRVESLQEALEGAGSDSSPLGIVDREAAA